MEAILNTFSMFSVFWTATDAQGVDFLASLTAQWVSSLLGMLAMVMTRTQYRYSTYFRKVTRASGFFELDADAPKKEAAEMAKKLLRVFPTTVSELVSDQNEVHGNIFKALFISAGIVQSQVDFNHFFFMDNNESVALGLASFNIWRKLFQVASLMTFPFVPCWKGTFPNYRSLKNFKSAKDVPTEMRDFFVMEGRFSKLHQMFASPLLLFCPFLETILGGFVTYASLGKFDPRNALDLLWLFIAVLRLTILATAVICILPMMQNLELGMVFPSKYSMRAFWNEYNIGICFLQSMSLLTFVVALNPGNKMRDILFGDMAILFIQLYLIIPRWIQTVKMLVRTFRDEEIFSQDDYEKIFRSWKKAEAKAQEGIDTELGPTIERMSKIAQDPDVIATQKLVGPLHLFDGTGHNELVQQSPKTKGGRSRSKAKKNK